MLERKTIIDDIHITRNGEVKVTLALQILDDGEETAISYDYITIAANTTVDEQVAIINADLALTKKAPLEDVTLLKKVAEIVYSAEALVAADAIKR